MNKTFVSRLALAMVVIICLATITVLAADTEYVPSIEAAPVPEIVPPSEDKAEVGAVIEYDDNNTEEIHISDIFTVSYNEAKELIEDPSASTKHKKICEKFIAAHDDLKESGSVRESINGVDEFVEEHLNIKNPQYVVSNVFELDMSEHAYKLGGNTRVTVIFDNSKIKAKHGEFIVVHMVDDEWKIVPNDDVTVTEEAIEVSFDSLCPVAFINVTEGEAVDEPVVEPSGCNDAGCKDFITTLIVVIVVIVVVAVVAVVGGGSSIVALFVKIAKKKKSKGGDAEENATEEEATEEETVEEEATEEEATEEETTEEEATEEETVEEEATEEEATEEEVTEGETTEEETTEEKVTEEEATEEEVTEGEATEEETVEEEATEEEATEEEVTEEDEPENT